MKFEFPKLRIEDLPMPTAEQMRIPQRRSIHLETTEFDEGVILPSFYRTGWRGHHGPAELF